MQTEERGIIRAGPRGAGGVHSAVGAFEVDVEAAKSSAGYISARIQALSKVLPVRLNKTELDCPQSASV